MSDAVNPGHYKAHPSGVECIDVVEHMNFNLGNAIKYVWRATLKGALVEDLKKARWYVTREIDRISGAGVSLDRDRRQRQVGAWCAAAFGTGHASSLPQRGVRLLEEAVEAAQAAGVERAMALKLVDFVYDRPPGALGQELGGVSLTLLALASASGFSAEAEEARELARVLAKPLEHFAARNAAKNAAGFNVATAGEGA